MTTPPFLAAGLPVAHGFFTRAGGVSKDPYASLNCSLSGNDAREAVLENRGRAAAALGARPDRLVGLAQVHGAEVVTVEQPWAPGQGPRADAMVTRVPGIALGVVTADCAPVLFADAEAGVIGAAHAGWRGAVAGVLEATAAAMVALGAAPPRIAAAIGPCIAQKSYEVRADLRDAVIGEDGAAIRFFMPGGSAHHWHFDLPGYCAARLARAGIGAIHDVRTDTLDDPARFFSHRRQTLAGGGPIGHQISAVRL